MQVGVPRSLYQCKPAVGLLCDIRHDSTERQEQEGSFHSDTWFHSFSHPSQNLKETNWIDFFISSALLWYVGLSVLYCFFAVALVGKKTSRLGWIGGAKPLILSCTHSFCQKCLADRVQRKVAHNGEEEEEIYHYLICPQCSVSETFGRCLSIGNSNALFWVVCACLLVAVPVWYRRQRRLVCRSHILRTTWYSIQCQNVFIHLEAFMCS